MTDQRERLTIAKVCLENAHTLGGVAGVLNDAGIRWGIQTIHWEEGYYVRDRETARGSATAWAAIPVRDCPTADIEGEFDNEWSVWETNQRHTMHESAAALREVGERAINGWLDAIDRDAESEDE